LGARYLKNQIPSEEKQRYHFFNSFFFRKLADLDKDPSNVKDGKAAFLRVHKWTRKVDLFGKDYIFIPVNFK
jgi:sentrin-specific protease 7